MPKLRPLTIIQKAKLQVDIKRANQRLRQLEKSGFTSSSAYRAIVSKMTRKTELFAKTKSGQIKFTTKIPKDRKTQQALIRELDRFLNAKTSTVKGTKKAYEKSFNTFNKNYPNNDLTFNQFLEMVENTNFKNILNMFGSSEVIDIINVNKDKTAIDSLLDDIQAKIDTGEISTISEFKDSYGFNPFEDDTDDKYGGTSSKKDIWTRW